MGIASTYCKEELTSIGGKIGHDEAIEKRRGYSDYFRCILQRRADVDRR